MLNRLSVQSKLFIVFSLMLLVGAVSSVLLLAAVNQITTEARSITRWAESRQNFHRIQSLMLEQSTMLGAYAASGDEAYLTEMLALERQIEELILQERINSEEEYNSLGGGLIEFAGAGILVPSGFPVPIQQDDPLAQRIIAERYTRLLALARDAVSLRQDYDDVFYNLDTVGPDAALLEARGALLDRQAALDDVLAEIDALILQEEAYLEEQTARIQSAFQRTILIGAISMTVLFVLAGAGALMTNAVATPLGHLIATIANFEDNLYNPELIDQYDRRGDEVGQLVGSFTDMVGTINREGEHREQMLTASRRFVPEAYLDFLSKPSVTDIGLGDHIAARMTVMFSDIRGFTTMSEGMTPKENFDFVNTYLARVSPIIQENNGFVVKFLGDGMMAIFPYDVDDAGKAAIAKQRSSQAVSQALDASINLGVGIHAGNMMVGIIGEELRLQGDAFSDDVNLTARIEGLNKMFGTAVLISEEARRQLRDPKSYLMRPIGKVQVKGKELPITLHEVFDAAPKAKREAKQATLSTYMSGMRSFYRGDFVKARADFARVLQQHPDDGTAQFFGMVQ